MARHPVLLVSWAILVLFGVLAFMHAPVLILVPILCSPLVSIATFAAVGRSTSHTFKLGWRVPHHLALVGLVIAGLAGIVMSAARIVTDEHGWYFENAPVGLLFLLAMFAGWRAVTRPSPRRAALPALLVHVCWIPLSIINLFTVPGLHYIPSRIEGMFWSGVAILGFSFAASVIAILGFEESDPVVAPARVA